MKDDKRDEVSESALLLFPMVKRLYGGDPGDPVLASLRNQTYFVLRMLEMAGPLPTSAIGKQLFIAKQNMTTLVDRLVNQGLAERENDAADRRVIRVMITEKGREFLKEGKSELKKIVMGNLAKLTDEDIESLHSAFRAIRNIVDKLV